MIESVLEEIGLSKNESKVYLAVLDLGLSSATKISEKSKLHRANVYDTLRKLSEKGFVSQISKENTTFYETTDPKFLHRLMKEKENQLAKIMPQLILRKQMTSSKSEAHIIQGVSGFMNLLYEILDYQSDILAYGIPKVAPEILKRQIGHYHVERLKRKIKMYHIYNFKAMDRINYLNTMDLTYAKFLPQTFDSEASTTVCGEQVLITHWVKPVVTVQIIDKAIADSYRKYFNILWKSSKKVMQQKI